MVWSWYNSLRTTVLLALLVLIFFGGISFWGWNSIDLFYRYGFIHPKSILFSYSHVWLITLLPYEIIMFLCVKYITKEKEVN